MKSIYLIGALKNQAIPDLANALRKEGYDAFEDWWSPGPEADLFWKEHEKRRGRSYKEALKGYHAQHVLAFDRHHLNRCDGGILVLPAGRSGHLELGYLLGQGKPGYVLFDQEPDRYDVMYGLATNIHFSLDDIIKELKDGSQH